MLMLVPVILNLPQILALPRDRHNNFKLVHRRWMGDLCVVDFPSLLLVPMLECIVQRSSSAI